MTDKTNTTPIYSITVGDPIKGMKFRVGQRVKIGEAGEGVISGITEDEINYALYGKKTYLVHVEPEDDEYYDFVWRKYEDQPVELIFSALKRI